jgi:beta-lactam-binding protein with PASTA domain
VTYVPLVTGFSALVAEALLTQAGLSVGSITTRASAELAGIVLESQPPAYSAVERGSAVNLVVAGPL